MEPKHGARDDAESAQSASDKFRQVIPGDVFYHLAAAARQRAVRQRNRRTDNQVAQRTKTQTERSAVICRKHSANGRFFRPQGIKRQSLPVLRQRFLQSLNRATGFNSHREIRPGVLDDFIQPRR